MASSTGKKGCKKAGRNAVFCKLYRDRGQREKNQVVRLNRHLKVHLNDFCALKAKERATALVRGY